MSFCYSVTCQNVQVRVYPYDANLPQDRQRAEKLALSLATKLQSNGPTVVEHFTTSSTIGTVVPIPADPVANNTDCKSVQRRLAAQAPAKLPSADAVKRAATEFARHPSAHNYRWLEAIMLAHQRAVYPTRTRDDSKADPTPV